MQPAPFRGTQFWEMSHVATPFCPTPDSCEVGWGAAKSKHAEGKCTVPHLVPQLLHIIDLLEGHHRRGEAVAQLGQQHPVAEALLQLHWGRKLLLQAGLHPAVSTSTPSQPLQPAMMLSSNLPSLMPLSSPDSPLPLSLPNLHSLLCLLLGSFYFPLKLSHL